MGLEFSLDGAVSDEARLLSYDRVANTRRGMVLDGDLILEQVVVLGSNYSLDANTTYDIGSR